MSPHPGLPPAVQKHSLKKKMPSHHPVESPGGLFLGWATMSANSQPPPARLLPPGEGVTAEGLASPHWPSQAAGQVLGLIYLT